MLSKNVLELLQYRYFAPSFRKPGTYGPSYWMTERFYDSLNPLTNPTDKVTFIDISTDNSIGKANVRSGVANVIDTPGMSEKTDGMFHQFDSFAFDPDVLRAITEPDSRHMQSRGAMLVNMAREHFDQKARMYKEALIRSLVLYHRVNIGKDKTLKSPTVHATTGAITDASDLMISADFGIPDTHRGNLNGAIAAYWTDTSAKISEQLMQVQINAAKAGEIPPTKIIMNIADFPLLKENAEFKAWAINNTDRPTRLLNGNGTRETVGFGIERLWGFDWEFRSDYFRLGTSESANQVASIPMGLAVLYSEPQRWMRAYKGVTTISIDPVKGFATFEEAANAFIEAEGIYAYARISGDPVKVTGYRGDCFGWSIPTPGMWTARIRASLSEAS